MLRGEFSSYSKLQKMRWLTMGGQTVKKIALTEVQI